MQIDLIFQGEKRMAQSQPNVQSTRLVPFFQALISSTCARTHKSNVLIHESHWQNMQNMQNLIDPVSNHVYRIRKQTCPSQRNIMKP